MNNPNKKSLKNLPRIFQAIDGSVDIDLLRKIIPTFISKPSGKIKSLLNSIFKHRKHSGDSFTALSLEIASSNFREQWYAMSDREESSAQKIGRSRYKQIYPGALYVIVRDWQKKYFLDSKVELPNLTKFLTKKNNKEYPRLDCIGVLSEEILRIAKFDTKNAALFTWALLENAEWNSLSQPSEESLSQLRVVLMEDLKQRDALEILALLEDAVFSNEAKTLSNVKKTKAQNDHAVKPNVVSELELININNELSSVIKLNDFCLSSLDELNNCILNLISQHGLAKAKVENLLNSKNYNQDFGDACQLLKNMLDEMNLTSSNAALIENEIQTIVIESMQDIPVEFCRISFRNFSIFDYEQWKSSVLTHQCTAKEVLRAASRLKQYDRNLVNVIALSRNEKSITLNNAASYLNAVDKEAALMSHGIYEKEKIIKIFQVHELEFIWNPIFSPEIATESWIKLGEYLAVTGGMPTVLGFCVRKHYGRFQKRIAELIDDYSLREAIPLKNTFQILSSMTLGQVGGLNCVTEGGRALLAVFELDCFLRIVDSSPTDAYQFSSEKPLRDYLGEQGSTASERFFEAANRVAFRNGDQRLTVSEIWRLVSATSTAFQIPLVNSFEIQKSDLLAIIEFHRGGGPTFAMFWDLAYQKICRPLREKAEKGDIEGAANIYRILRNEFDIDNELRSWRTTIPERLRKESVYEKKLRLAVRAKLDLLDAWLLEYESTKQSINTKEDDEDIVLLKSAISEVILNQDTGSNVLRCWFQSLANASCVDEINIMSISRLQEPEFIKPLNKFTDNPFFPKTFLNSLKKQNSTTADLLSDKLFVSFGLYAPSMLAKCYAAQKQYEAFEALYVAVNDEIPLDLVRQVESEVENLEINFLGRIVDVESKIDLLEQDNAEFITVYINTVKELVESQKWIEVELELSEVERTFAGILEEIEYKKVTQLRLVEIKALGGLPPDDLSYFSVELAHKSIITESESRREHLSCFKKLVETAGLNPVVEREIAETLSVLQAPKNLPNTERSIEVDYIFSTTLGVLADELRRAKNYNDNHRSKLNALSVRLARELRLIGVCEGSTIINLLIDTAALWEKIPDGVGNVEELLLAFSSSDTEDNFVEEVEIQKTQSLFVALGEAKKSEILIFEKNQDLFSYYIELLDKAVFRLTPQQEGGNAALKSVIVENPNIKSSDSDSDSDSKAQRSSSALEHLTDLAITILKNQEDRLTTEELAAVFHLINSYPSSKAVRALTLAKGFKAPFQLAEVATRFFVRVARDCGLIIPTEPFDQIQFISENIDCIKQSQVLIIVAFSPIGAKDSVIIKSLWDSFTGDKNQAESRAALMNIFWKTSATNALACCLSYVMEQRKALRFAAAASQALDQGRVEQLQSFIDLRKSVLSKPFQLFVDKMQRDAPIHTEDPASLELLIPLSPTGQENIYRSIISIRPRAVEKPDSITITLPQTAPIRFVRNPDLRCRLEGPFLDIETQLDLEFRLLESNATEFSVTLDCEAESINAIRTKFEVILTLKVGNPNLFQRPTSNEIEDAFNLFPEYQVRGPDYVLRVSDEKRIERALFESKTVRSLWISSPRRSGKTTMLYRILDDFSHKVGRDNLVAYFTLDTSFTTNTAFNQWIWKSLVQKKANKELRDCFDDFLLIGRELPFNADTGTFFEVLSDRLKQSSNLVVNRVIYLIDEIDRFAMMYFEGGDMKAAAIDVTWQIRNLLSERRDIGFVFAGSSAAKSIFLSDAQSPFFTTGSAFELTPFSCETPSQEEAVRTLIEPIKMRGFFKIGRKTLDHLIWVCAGIPYYMKLLTGASMAVAKQPYLLVSDVNAGLTALLSKTTGISKLDELSGTPGSDELRTIALKIGPDRLLTEAVVYAVAEMYSPLSGHRLYRGKITSAESRLVSRFLMNKETIEKGLELAISLDILKIATDSHKDISFTIPILGESIRHSSAKFWGSKEHQIENLVSQWNAL